MFDGSVRRGELEVFVEGDEADEPNDDSRETAPRYHEQMRPTDEELRLLKKLHENLGHPGPKELCPISATCSGKATLGEVHGQGVSVQCLRIKAQAEVSPDQLYYQSLTNLERFWEWTSSTYQPGLFDWAFHCLRTGAT